MRNKYGDNCVRCRMFVPSGAGFFEKVNRSAKGCNQLHEGKTTKWVVRCQLCVGKGHTEITEEEKQERKEIKIKMLRAKINRGME